MQRRELPRPVNCVLTYALALPLCCMCVRAERAVASFHHLSDVNNAGNRRCVIRARSTEPFSHARPIDNDKRVSEGEQCGVGG